MSRWGARHLAQVEDEHGTGTGSAAIRQLIETGIKAANDAQQKARVEAKGTDKKENAYVTDAGKCPRKVWLSLKNVPETEELSTDSYVNFGVGHAVEDWLAATLEAQGAEIIREHRVQYEESGVAISGRVDFLVTLPDYNCLIELKTTSSRAMSFMLKNQEAGKDDHRRQANLYCHFSHLAPINGRSYDTAFLVYVVKDATRREPTIHAFEVKYDEQEAKADIKNLVEISHMARKDIDPGIPVGYTKSKWPCNYCGFRSFCHKGKP